MKDVLLFKSEINAILAGSSAHHRGAEGVDSYDFCGFVFPEMWFQGSHPKEPDIAVPVHFKKHAFFTTARFIRDVHFCGATFNKSAHFSGADFHGEADFRGTVFLGFANFESARFRGEAFFNTAVFRLDSVFWMARFDKDVDLSLATFLEGACFSKARFGGAAILSETSFGGLVGKSATPLLLTAQKIQQSVQESGSGAKSVVADFAEVEFAEPARTKFWAVNKWASQGLRVRFVDCDIERVNFEDVNWFRRDGRITLQDELDITSGNKTELGESFAEEINQTRQELQGEKRYELVAIVYRRLVNNFEKSRSYDLAEDCYVGAMEMKRLDPKEPLSSRALVTLYKWLSLYGSSYTRALWMLVVLLLAFALLFPVFGLRMAGDKRAGGMAPGEAEASISWGEARRHPNRGRELWGTFKAGLWAAVETATFQRSPTVEPANTWGKRLGVIEIVVIPGQVALFFLALRRRFRR